MIFIRQNATKKARLTGGLYFSHQFALSAGDLTAAEAPGAHIDVPGASVHYRLNALDIGAPGTIGAPVGVADLYAKGNALSAEITLCHFFAPPLN